MNVINNSLQLEKQTLHVKGDQMRYLLIIQPP